MSPIYHRPDLAHEMATQLLSPGVLDQGLRSGLFLSGLRRTGKTTFLRQDLIPALENAGALVIYVDLWSDVKRPYPRCAALGIERHAIGHRQSAVTTQRDQEPGRGRSWLHVRL